MRFPETGLTALILALASTCVLAGSIETLPPAWAPTLKPVPAVDLSPLKADEQNAITEGRSKVDALLAQEQPNAGNLASEYGRLGNLYLIHGLYTSADACYDNAMQLQPEHFPWAYYSAYLEQQNGDLQAALAAYKKAVALDPSYPPAQYRLALVYLDMNRPDEAYNLLLPLLKNPDYEAAASYGLGQVYLSQQEHLKAIERFSRALELQPGATSIHYPLAMSLRAAGQNDQARQHLKLFGKQELVIKDRLVDSLQALRNPAARHFATAMTAVLRKEYPTAVEEFDKGMEFEPGNVAARTSYARVLYLNGDREKSRAELERVIASAPDKSLAVFLLALIEDESGNRDEALKLYRRVIELDPDHEGANFFLANHYLLQKEFTNAVLHYDVSLKANEKNLAAMLYRLAAMMGAGAPDRELLTATRDITGRAPNMEAIKRIQVLLLALSKDENVRDAALALKLADQMQQQRQHPVNLELVAISHAAAGDYETAATRMRAAVSAEKKHEKTPNLARMENTLSLLEDGKLPVLDWHRDVGYMLPPPTKALATFRDYPDPNPI